MSDLRHSRGIVRAQRERIIKKKKALLDSVLIGGYLGDKNIRFPLSRTYNPPPLGKLSKHSLHHHRCDYCVIRYNRAKEKRIGADAD